MDEIQAVPDRRGLVGGLSLAALAGAWILAARNNDLFDISVEFGPDRFMVAYAVAGTVLASRQRSNPVGWFLLGIGLVAALRGLAGEYVRYALATPSHPGHLRPSPEISA